LKQLKPTTEIPASPVWLAEEDAQEISASYNTDDAPVADDRNPLDPMIDEQTRYFADLCRLAHGDNGRRHDGARVSGGLFDLEAARHRL
jgi:hypothetical protein